MLQVDYAVKPEDIQILRNPDAIVGFFAKLGYDTNKRVVQNPQHLGISNQTLLDQIKRVERLSEDGLLRIYLIELSSVTVANTLQLSRSFKEMSGFFILVLTSDYERIDFVFLDRVIPLGKKDEVITKPRFALRPRSRTVNRSNPDTISKRVLRRLTFTEVDEFAQYDKIRSAYTMADWAEDFFNNRALFSDYFLIHRLKDDSVWKEKIESSYLVLKNKLKPFSSQWCNVKEDDFHNKFIEQVLAELGFEFEKVSKTSAEEVKPHYILLSKSDKKKVGAMLSYCWGRHLDAKDYTRDTINPEENPSQAVVTVLEEEVPWVIVTNGKAWRLYSAKAHSRATNYFEIDLEETIALDDPNEAFRYYWLLFREDAFIPRLYILEGEERKMSFLDKLLYHSQEYSKELEEKLKNRVFEEVFPFFAEGFIQTIGGKEKLLGLSEDERHALCRDVFSATLTILYRLLFLLYAESRDLLPSKEVRGYYDKSLTRLKKEIAGKAGNIADDVELKLKNSYTKSNVELYDRLMELAEIIDKGKSSLNVPTYNGGLFLTELTEGDNTREVEIARFLTRYKIPDYYLAIGLDKLARVEDTKKFELVPIDYKSLGIRQLGSIYEGLLEFNVRIASERMAVVKGKKTDQVVPYKVAVKKELKIVTTGRGSEKREYILPRGSVYIENDKKERKATGSYYTPDYIVKYIVENTVGLVLEEKFKGIRPKLRTLRPEQVETEGAKRIIDDLFDIHVIDPAMGSGHFLVETVDYITDKMLDFLNGFPSNPVQLELQRTRDSIMDEMNRQGVSIDQNKLIDVSLMKRYVLKRCIYGVDLNPMAVELAKVSLWLDCFTLGAPLSFLDHHLKCGNSLIGASLKEAEKEIESGQMTLWATSKFGGVKRASEHMIHVGELSDITTNMIEESKKEYCKATREIEPYKQLLDIYTSRWFSNSPIITGKGKNKVEYDYTLDFLRSDEMSEWLKDTSETKNLDKEKQQIIKNALIDAAKKRFFHWELEFPEIFCGKEEERGFDAVIGNPPYDVLAEKELGYPVDQEKKFFKSIGAYSPAIGKKLNIYRFFTVKGIYLTKEKMKFSFIVPMAILGDDQASNLRKWILNNFQIEHIEAFPQKDDPYRRVFFEAKLPTAIIVLSRKSPTLKGSVVTHPGRLFEEMSKSYKMNQKKIQLLDKYSFSIPLITEGEWILCERIFLSNHVKNIGEQYHSHQGEINETSMSQFLAKEPLGPQILRGGVIQRYKLLDTPKQGEKWYLNIEKYLKEVSDKSRKADVNSYRLGYQRNSALDNYRRLISTIIPPGNHLFDSISYLVPKEQDKFFLLGMLNSNLLEFRFRLTSTNNHVNGYEIESLPLRIISFNTSAELFDLLLENSKQLYEDYLSNKKINSLLDFIEDRLPKDEEGNFLIEKEESDVVHALLSFLAEQMILLNETNQTVARMFLEWLESRFHIEIAELSGRTLLIEYYKHNFEDFYSVLKSNKNHLPDIRDENVKGELLIEFKKSMKTIEPLLDRIETTDDLIDQIVYKLYGLTNEEIEIVKKSVGGH